MKEIIAIIRNECVEPTRSALAKIGILHVAFLNVWGQGRQDCTTRTPGFGNLRHEGKHDAPVQQHGFVPWSDSAGSANVSKKGSGQRFLPRTMLIMAVIDEEVLPVIQALIRVNQSGRHGDGRIFVCPMVTTVGIGTGK